MEIQDLPRSIALAGLGVVVDLFQWLLVQPLEWAGLDLGPGSALGKNH
jgi:hypothetical protein